MAAFFQICNRYLMIIIFCIIISVVGGPGHSADLQLAQEEKKKSLKMHFFLSFHFDNRSQNIEINIEML